jgi:predicted transcriptional regulator
LPVKQFLNHNLRVLGLGLQWFGDRLKLVRQTLLGISMTDTPAAPRRELLDLSSAIVAAYVSNNSVPVADLPAMIKSVHAALGGLAGTQVEAQTQQKPAVPLRKSITPDHVICLEDGKKLTMLKRYLRGTYDMTPEQYRAKWGLPPDYPMVAPNYSKKRSDFAKKIGLGRTSASAKRKKRA